MARKKRASAAARAAKARATKEASQQKKSKEEENSVLDEDDVASTSSATSGQNQVTSETAEVQAPSSPKDVEEDVNMVTSVEKNTESTAVIPDSNEQSEEPSKSENTTPQEDAPTTSKDKPTADASEMPPADDNQEVVHDPTYHVNAMLTDKSYLIDVSVGYSDEANLKEPLKCFTTKDELQLFPVIESMSAKLYTIVQKMNACQKQNVETAMKLRKGFLKLPSLRTKSFLCQVNVMGKPTETEKSAPTKRAPHPFLLTEDENMFSEDKLKMLRSVLDAGWKREVVMRSPGSTGRKTGDVYYYSPNGTKFRSSKQVVKHLADMGDTPFTIENFTFAKVRISTNPEQEIVRKAYDGKSPPRAPPKSSSKAKAAAHSKGESSKSAPKPCSSTSKESLDVQDTRAVEEPAKGVSSRRSIQPPKRYSGDAVLLLSKRSKVQDDKHRNSSNKGLMQMGMLPPKYPKGVEDSSSNITESMEFNELGGSNEDLSGSNSVAMKEIAEDSLFQISALRQSGGIDVENMHQLVESQKQLAQKAAQAALNQEEQQGNVAGSSKRGGGTVIPCSIRCPGMDGAVPNLQCIRCLCLFHAECLGLPPNLAFNKYLCTNCTTEQKNTSGAAPNPVNSHKTRINAGVATKRSPPGLAPIPHGGILRGPAATREVTVTLAAKEALTRLPHKTIPSSVGVARGMIRSRGMPPPPGRSPSAQMHSGHRMIVSESPIPMMGGHPQIVKRGRGRPPSVPPNRPMPQIAKNLTITSLPRIPGAPPVPNLQPMGAPKAMSGKIALPLMAGGTKPRQAAMPTVPNLMKSNAFRLTVPPPSLSGRTFKKAIPPPHTQNPTNLRLNPGTPVVTKSASVVQGTTQDRTISIVKRYPQSVCSIGNKKFVVLPKRRPADFPPATTATAVGNGGLSKGNALDGLRNTDITIKKTITARDQINSVGNDLVSDESMVDGLTEVDNNDATPMDEREDEVLDMNAGANEPIAANQ